MARFTNRPVAIRSLDQELFSNFDELRGERVATDNAIVAWATALQGQALAAELNYTLMSGAVRKYPTWFAVAHFFNHQAHHRGQLTTLLSQLGIDFGVTDLIAFDFTSLAEIV